MLGFQGGVSIPLVKGGVKAPPAKRQCRAGPKAGARRGFTFIAVRCPHCQSDQIVKRGKTARGTQRYLCQNPLCAKGSFLLDYCNRGCLPEVKHTIIDMRLNASGVRDTARSLHICPNTVLRELKK